jgi:hypothetical protein
MRTLIAIGIVLLAGTPPASANVDQGILILAPSGTAEWNAAITELTAKADAQKPTELALGTPTHATIEAAVERLVKRGAAEVTAVPFFLSTAPSPELGTGYPVPLRLASSPASDAVFAEVILGRAQEISRSPSEEVILLVGYGADGDGTPWSVNLAPAAQRLNQMRRFGSLLLISRPDAQTEREQMQVRNSLKRLAGPQSRILVVPILTLPSAGDPNIEQYLQGYTHEVAKSGVISDARLVEWLLSRAAGQ